ncbi:ferredoxin [Nocardia macrotermitis]|uniref:Ferredoxin n=1 Tax=Nocardia macrotermitis TaxID=2585198 RepID=A0A7K0CZ91_9NOCA|nr:ferredoxin [Nocardia macrotermitis]MQY18768.1 Ferredoxin [Nocardia macrotermitis]
MKVSIDSDRCRGHGICLGICPEVFELSDDGYAEAEPDVPAQYEGAVREAASACPEQAIVVS